MEIIANVSLIVCALGFLLWGVKYTEESVKKFSDDKHQRIKSLSH